MSGWRRSLGPRLLVTFVAVALLGIAVLALLVALGYGRDVRNLAADERQRAADVIADAAADAYQEAGGWEEADLGAVSAQAATYGASLVLLDAEGTVVAAFDSSGSPASSSSGRGRGPHSTVSPDAGSGASSSLESNAEFGVGQGPMGPPAQSGSSVSADVMVDGVPVGSVALRFPAGTVLVSEAESLLWQWILIAGIAALVAAFAAALLVTRRITGPLRRLDAAVTRVRAGERDVDLRREEFPGELGEVADSVAALAADLDRQDALRRAALADVTHELRTPVAVLQGYLEELVDGVSDPDPERLALLHDETLRISRLITDLETLREAEASGLELQRTSCDLARAAGAAVDLLASQAQAADVPVATELSPAPLYGDEARLRQVVLNLLTNSLKYAEGAGVTVRTSTQLRLGLETAVLEVVDHGPGILDEELPYVFERYWRGSSGRRVSGNGIGLAVVRLVVAAHSGTVRAEGTPGGGTTMRVELPVTADVPDQPRST